MAADNPERPGSRSREEIAPGVRSLHIELAARRLGAAAHILYYCRGRLESGGPAVIILRVLYEGMEPLRHLTPESP